MKHINQKKTIIAIFILALLVRTIYLIELAKPIGAIQIYSKIIIEEVGMQKDIGLAWPRLLGADSSIYDGLAMNLVNGRGYSGAYWPPLFPYFLALLYMIFGQTSPLIRFVFGVISSVTCVLIYLIGRKAFNEEVGLISSVIAVFHPSLVIFSAFYVTETLFLFLITSFFLFFFTSLDESSSFQAVIAGISLGLASLCRSIALGFIPFILLALFFNFKNHHKKIMKIFVIMIAAIFLTITPWMIRNYLVLGRFSPLSTNGAIAFYIGNNPEATGSYYWPKYMDERFNNIPEVERERMAYKLGLKYIINDPSSFARRSIYKFYLFWIYKFPSGPIGYLDDHRVNIRLLTLLGLLGAGLSLSEWRRVSILYLFMIYITLIHILFLVLPRYRMPIVPILMIFSGYLITYSADQIKKKGKIFKLEQCLRSEHIKKR